MNWLRKLLCAAVGHQRRLAYDENADYELVVWCYRCGTVVDRG